MCISSAAVNSNGHPAELVIAKFLTIVAGMLPLAVSAEPSRRVVLVHGFLDKGAIFKKLEDRLTDQGFTCLMPSLSPSDGRGGLEKLATDLQQEIDAKFGRDQSFSIVSFSMGGIISRYYLQDLGQAKRCEKFITISAPHHGTVSAWFYPGKGAQQMRPGSAFLKHLHDTEDRLGNIPITSLRTPMDLMIFPSHSSVWERAENLKYPILFHPMMLTSPKVLGEIERRLIAP